MKTANPHHFPEIDPVELAWLFKTVFRGQIVVFGVMPEWSVGESWGDYKEVRQFGLN